MRLFYIFPVTGPNNGVKVISNNIKNAIFKQKNISLIVIDTAQAQGFGNFGKFSLKKILFLFRLIKKTFLIKSSDLVYLNLTPKGYAFYRDCILLAICRLKTKQVTAHVHANGLEKKINSFNRFLFSSIKIIVINKNQKKKLVNFCPNIFLVPNALPDYYNNNQPKFKLNNEINLIFLSNISKEKGVDRIIETANILNANNINCKINIYGGLISGKDKIYDLVTKYSFVDYFGPVVENKEKYDSLLANDVLLFLSDENYEVYPLVYIEALMNGLPIITTNQVVAEDFVNLGVAEILKRDLSNLLEIINKLVNDERNLIEIKTQTRRKYLEKYSFDKFTNKLEEILLYDTRKSN